MKAIRRWVPLLLVVAVFAMASCGADEEAASGSAPGMDPEAVALTDHFAPVDPGTYRVDSVGTPFTLTTKEPLFVFRNGEAWFVLSVPESQGPSDHELLFMRMTDLSDPSQPTVSIDQLDEAWPAADFEGWLDNLSDDIVITNREQVLLGGLEALRVDLELGEVECGSPRVCADFASNHLVIRKALDSGAQYRMWFVEQGEEDPLVVIVAINRETDAAWFDTAEGILETVAFGEVAPNPVAEVPGGLFESAFLGGVRVDIAEDSYALEDARGFGRLGVAGEHGDAEFVAGLFDTEGAALHTSEEVVAALESASVAVTEVASIEIDGIDAKVVDVASSINVPALKLRSDADDDIGWWAPPLGRLWLLDHPDRGLLMVTIWAYDELETQYPQMVARTETMLASLEFIDLS